MDLTAIDALFGVLITMIGWWVALVTARMIDLQDRVANLEGRQEERDKEKR